MDDARLDDLLEKDLDNRLTDAERIELMDELRRSADARRRYWESMEQHVLIGAVLSESRGQDLAQMENEETVTAPAAVAPSANRRWRRGWAIVVVATCLLVGLGLWLRPREETPLAVAPFATVGDTSGQVEVCDESGRTFPAAPGTAIHAGQVLRVGDEDARVEVVFGDGTQITLQSGSSLRFPPGIRTDEKHIHLERGALQVQSPDQANATPLVVSTDDARLTAAGNRFRIYKDGTTSRVELEQGHAHLQSPGGAAAVDLAQGSFVVASSDAQPMVAQPMAPASCRLRHTFPRTGDAVAFSPDGTKIVTSHFHRSGLKAWNTRDGAVVATAPGIKQRTHGMAFVTAETVVAIAADGTAVQWTPGEPQAVLTKLRDKDLRQAALSSDGRWIAQPTKGEVAIWEVNPETSAVSLRNVFPARPTRVALSSGEAPQVAIGPWGGDVSVHDAATGRELLKHKLKGTPVPLALSDDSRFVVACTNSDGIVLIDQMANTRRTLWAPEASRANHLSFSTDGRIVVAGMNDGMIRAWSTDDGRSLLVLESGYRGGVHQTTLSPDRTLLATVGDNDCVKIWECNLP